MYHYHYKVFTRTISNILKKPKDKIEKEASRGIVYKIKDCDCVYVGQTSRALKTRMKEHAKAIATLQKLFVGQTPYA